MCSPIVGFDWAVDSCSWMSRCHLFFSRLSLAVSVGVRDEEAAISRLSPWRCLWQRDSTVQVRTARNTRGQTHTLYSSATQQNRTNHKGAFLRSQPSVQITAQRDWITPALQPWEATRSSSSTIHPLFVRVIVLCHTSLQYYQKVLFKVSSREIRVIAVHHMFVCFCFFISLWNTTAKQMTDGGHRDPTASCWETVYTH